MASKKTLQLGTQIKEHIALLLAQGKIADPRIKDVTIQYVKLAPDLQSAKVYYSVLNDGQRAEVQKGLDNASAFIRHSLAQSLNIRYTPAVRFYFDESLDRAHRIYALLS